MSQNPNQVNTLSRGGLIRVQRVERLVAILDEQNRQSAKDAQPYLAKIRKLMEKRA